METSQKKINVKDFFLNLGGTIALYVVVVSLINLLFTIINNVYPKITNAYYYAGTSNISWPVAVLVIFTPILVLLMWLLEKQYILEPEKKDSGVHKWLTYITLFISGLVIAGDLIMVLYYFIDGQELDKAFLLKCLTVIIITSSLFGYYISDIRGKISRNYKKVWQYVSIIIIIASIAWGFSVLGSPRTQRLIKYDAQKINDLQMINSYVQSYYQMKGSMPQSINDLSTVQYSEIPTDPQTGNPYEYKLVGQSAKAYELCAEFNLDAKDPRTPKTTTPYGDVSWIHPAGHYCYKLAIPVGQYVKLPM